MTAGDPHVVGTGGAWRRSIPAAAAAAAFLVMAALYLLDNTGPYHRILQAWGVKSWAFPFLDTDTVLSAVRCLNQGIDVYTVNPCDPLGRVYDYSPLWLALAAYPQTGTWLKPIGLGVDIAFLLSLLLLPPGRSWRQTALITIGVMSPATAFAVERANNDLVLFVLAALAATLSCRSPALRCIGYGCALLAGLLKYYPMTLMALACRERPPMFFAVALCSTAVLAAFAVWTAHDLIRALQLIPTGSYFGDMVGAVTLGGGLAEITGAPSWFSPAIRFLFSATAIAVGLQVGMGRILQQDLERLRPAERTFLMAGILLVAAFFLSAQNIGYRVVHLVLVLPALMALCQTGTRRRLHITATLLALALLWAQAWREALLRTVADSDPTIVAIAIIPGWLLREAMWWTLITLLIGMLTALLARSRIVQSVWNARTPTTARRGAA